MCACLQYAELGKSGRWKALQNKKKLYTPSLTREVCDCDFITGFTSHYTINARYSPV